jgi:S1-C subfamily serine protease
VVTNEHVIHNAEYIEVRPPGGGEPIPANVVAIADDADLALLKCDGIKIPSLPVATVLPRKGAKVIAAGFPHFDEIGSGLKVTEGIVTGLPDPVATGNLLLFDAVINPGPCCRGGHDDIEVGPRALVSW